MQWRKNEFTFFFFWWGEKGVIGNIQLKSVNFISPYKPFNSQRSTIMFYIITVH